MFAARWWRVKLAVAADPEGLVLARETAVVDLRLDVVPVHHGDEVEADLLGTGLVALTVHGAGAEVLLHPVDHVLDAGPALGLALGEEAEVRDLGCREQVGGAVG